MASDADRNALKNWRRIERRYEGPVPEPILRRLGFAKADGAARRHAKAQATAVERLGRLTQRTMALRRAGLDGWAAVIDRRLCVLQDRLTAYRLRACALARSARA